MTRGRFYSTVMPIWAILYVIGIVAFHSKTFNVVGALVFALIAVVGATIIRPCVGEDRDRAARAERRAARRTG